MELVIQLIAGLIGGNALANAAKNLSLGPALNSIIGLMGGLCGGQILAFMDYGLTGTNSNSTLEISAVIANLLSGSIGGGLLVGIIGAIKNATAK